MDDTKANPKLPPVTLAQDYEFHELSKIFPLMEGDEFEALVESVRRQGILSPITLYQGKILDGRNRYNAAKAAGYKFTERDLVELPPDKDPKEYAISTNAQRRHLTTEQKRILVIKLLRERPNDSHRRIAALVGVSNKTVSSYAQELEEQEAKFKKAWHDLDAVQRRNFVVAHMHELRQAGAV
jgi:ParB-like chromosome segregation protein Spo0J